jgi:adenylate cyclase
MTSRHAVTEPDKRLERAIAAFVRQEFRVPIETIIGLTEILIEDARRDHNDPLVSDFDRIRSAGLLLQEELGRLVDFALQGSFPTGDDFAQFRANHTQRSRASEFRRKSSGKGQV